MKKIFILQLISFVTSICFSLALNSYDKISMILWVIWFFCWLLFGALAEYTIEKNKFSIKLTILFYFSFFLLLLSITSIFSNIYLVVIFKSMLYLFNFIILLKIHRVLTLNDSTNIINTTLNIRRFNSHDIIDDEINLSVDENYAKIVKANVFSVITIILIYISIVFFPILKMYFSSIAFTWILSIVFIVIVLVNIKKLSYLIDSKLIQSRALIIQTLLIAICFTSQYIYEVIYFFNETGINPFYVMTLCLITYPIVKNQKIISKFLS